MPHQGLEKMNFAFEKKVGINGGVYGDAVVLTEMFQRLLVCMRETNKLHGCECEFFRLDYRQPYLDERLVFPVDCFILDMKWGCRDELVQDQ